MFATLSHAVDQSGANMDSSVVCIEVLDLKPDRK